MKMSLGKLERENYNLRLEKGEQQYVDCRYGWYWQDNFHEDNIIQDD